MENVAIWDCYHSLSPYGLEPKAVFMTSLRGAMDKELDTFDKPLLCKIRDHLETLSRRPHDQGKARSEQAELETDDTSLPFLTRVGNPEIHRAVEGEVRAS